MPPLKEINRTSLPFHPISRQTPAVIRQECLMSMFNAFRRFMPGAACVVSLAAGTTTAVAQA